MIYDAPTDNGKPYYIPVTVRDKSYLVGYLHSTALFKLILKEGFQKMDVELDTSLFEHSLDSTRFNDIMVSGKKASDCSQKEINNYYQKLIDGKMERIKEPDPENNVFKDSILQLECAHCGFGFYNYEKVEEIPETNVTCQYCGKVLLHYTGHYDNEYDFDGKE